MSGQLFHKSVKVSKITSANSQPSGQMSLNRASSIFYDGKDSAISSLKNRELISAVDIVNEKLRS